MNGFEVTHPWNRTDEMVLLVYNTSTETKIFTFGLPGQCDSPSLSVSHRQGDGGGAQPLLPQILPDCWRLREQGVVGGPQGGRDPLDEPLLLEADLGGLVPGEDVHVLHNKYRRISRDPGLS